MVWVGPPLLASVPRPGVLDLSRLPLTAARPPEPPVPNRLFALIGESAAGGVARGGRPGDVGRDDRVVQGRRPLRRRRDRLPVPPAAAVLSAMVLLTSVRIAGVVGAAARSCRGSGDGRVGQRRRCRRRTGRRRSRSPCCRSRWSRRASGHRPTRCRCPPPLTPGRIGRDRGNVIASRAAVVDAAAAEHLAAVRLHGRIRDRRACRPPRCRCRRPPVAVLPPIVARSIWPIAGREGQRAGVVDPAARRRPYGRPRGVAGQPSSR